MTCHFRVHAGAFGCILMNVLHLRKPQMNFMQQMVSFELFKRGNSHMVITFILTIQALNVINTKGKLYYNYILENNPI